MSIATIPPTFYQVAFNADPNQNTLPPYWTDISTRVQFPWSTSRGRHYELDVVETGEWHPVLANADGALDPTNTASPYYPGVVPYRAARIRCLPGVNQLTPDQATAGEGSGFGAGPVPAQTLVSCGAGYPLSYAASGSAFQGAQVYQVAVPNGATTPKDLLTLARVPALPGTVYVAQAQVRMLATAQNLAVSVAIDWYNSSAAIISTSVNSGATLTGGSSTWVRVYAPAVAPAGTVYCTVRLVLGTTTSATASFQADGLQFEAGPLPTPFQVPNSVSVNLFPRAIATGGSSTGTAAGVWNPDAGIVAYATGLTAAPTGQSWAIGWTTPPGTTSDPSLWAGGESGLPSNIGRPSADNVQVTPGLSYTASVYGLRAASSDATLEITSQIVWYNSAGSRISLSSSSPLVLSTSAWGRMTVTATAPAGAAWGRFLIYISNPSSTAATNTVYLTGGQFEQAGAVSTWVDPGPAYAIIAPFMERWPQTWTEQDGTYGTDAAIGSDAFAGLSQLTLQYPYINELLALGPNFLFQLGEAAGATFCLDTAGKRVPAPVENSPQGAGSLVFGNAVTATAVPSGGFIGAAGPVATFGNTSPETYISLYKTTAVPGLPPAGPWTRLLAFRTTQTTGVGADHCMWNVLSNITVGVNTFQILQQAVSTSVLLQYVDKNLTAFQPSTPAGINDGNWHLVAIGVDPASGAGTAWCDGAVIGTATGLTTPAGASLDILGCSTTQAGFANGYTGDLALAVELPLLLTNSQMTALYNSWRSASSGESTGARVNRVLSWVGWTGPTAIDTGSTTSMGAATDLAGATALDALNNIALTENGTVYVSASGVLTFKGRSARYGQNTPAYTFGERSAAGEWPFEYLAFEFDPTHVMNSVQVTQYGADGGPTATAFDAASKARNWPRAYQRTINTTSVPECQDAANYLLSQNKAAHQRVEALRLHPSAVPGLFLVCLSLELGTRVRVNRRPTGAAAITFDGFVEKIDWDWNPGTGDVYVTLQCSPVDLVNYWVLAALHTTLHAQANAGANTISINALPDAAANSLASSLPSGYQLTLDPGTGSAETVTIAPGGIPATSPGWTSATLTLTANLTFTHAANAVVCEALPAGVTDPTKWDASSVIGVSYAVILSGGAVGTNTVTIGPLPDAAVNSLGSNWNTGDVVWLSPGVGARAEALTIASVATTYPGWTSCVITFTANFGSVHNAGEYVSDPLANNGINPATVSATARPAY